MSCCLLMGQRRGRAEFSDLGSEATALIRIVGPRQAFFQVAHFALSSLPSSKVAFWLSRHRDSFPPKDRQIPVKGGCSACFVCAFGNS